MKFPVACVLVLALAVAAPFADAAKAASGAPAARVFVEHEVADYAAWRKAYDAFAATRGKLGVTYAAVYQSADNPNNVIVIHDFASVEKAKAFVASDDLKSAMQKAGVKGQPHITVTTRAAK